MKKIFGLMLIFTLVATGFFVDTPAPTNAATITSVDSIQQSAPDTIYVDKIVNWGGYTEDYLFYSVEAYGTIYRGWVSKYFPGSTGPAAYHGTLYREPLQYPTPF